MQYLTEDLLSSIKLRAMVPISQATFQDPDLTLLANEELQLKLVADIMRERENFFLTSQLVSITAGVDTYTMPSRAIGNALKMVSFVDTQGRESKLTLVDVDRRADFTSSMSTASGSPPTGFWIEGDQVVILPKPNVTGGSLKIDFYARPNKLVATSACAKITGSSTAAGLTTFNVDTDLTATLLVGSNIDIISMASPFLLWGVKVPITAITSTTIQVSSANVSDQAGNVEPQLGDYISLTGTANIAQVPQEFHPVLAQMVANRLLWGLGDQNKLNSGIATLKEDRENAIALIKNRVEATPVHVNTRNGFVSAFSRRF